MSPKNLKQGYQYHKLGKTFSKLYHWYIYYDLISKIVSEYDQELPQSQSADNPMAQRGRAAQLNSMLDLNLSCTRVFLNQSFMAI